MKFGKREQIVVISLLGIGTIAFLHLMVFSPRASRFQEAFKKKTDQDLAVKGLQKPKDVAAIEKLKTLTKALDVEYNDIYTSLGVVHPPVFELPINPDDVKVEDMDPKPDPKKPPSPADLKKMKSDQLGKIRWLKRAPQIEAIYEQMDKLEKFDERSSGKTRVFFFGAPPHQGGLSYPFELKRDAKGGKLDDIISHIDQTIKLLGVIERENKALWEEQRAAYTASLAELGIDNSLFLDFSPMVKTKQGGLDYGGLAAKGEYMPLLVKLRWARLLEKAMLAAAQEAVRAAGGDPEKATIADKLYSGEPVTRDRIFAWLEISPPYDPVPGIRDSELYFLYVQLYYLNWLLETMLNEEHGVTEIYTVMFDEIAFQRVFLSVINPEPTKPEEKPKELRKNYHAIAPPEGQPVVAPFESGPAGKEDLGYAIVITLQYRVLNRNAWMLAYDILRDNPLASIDRMDIRSAGAGGDVFCDATFVFVPQFTESKPGNPKVFVPTPGPTPAPTPAPRATPAAPAAPAAPAPGATPASRIPAVR